MAPSDIRPLITFDPATHTYWWRGRSYPSVTQIIARSGVTDYSNVPPDVLKRAAKIGDRVHSAIHMHHTLKTELAADMHPEDPARSYLEAYAKFLKDTKYRSIASEVPSICAQYEFAGTIDSVGWLYGSRVLIDYKTTASENTPAWELQTAAYAYLWTHGLMNPRFDELDRGEIQFRYALHLRRTGKYSLAPLPDSTSFSRFVHMLNS